MKGMQVALLSLCLVAVVLGHTTLTNIIINGQTRTDCLRPTYDDRLYLQTRVGSTFPMSDEFKFPNGITGENYTCGWMPFAANPASTSCPVAAGSTVTVTHMNEPEKDSIPYLAPNHRGPFMVYLSRWEQTGGVPLGKTWFKIHELGIVEPNDDPELIKWAAPHLLVANQGKLSFTIPADLAPGRYLLRTEILSFLSSSRNGAQGYIRCAEITVTGNGNISPSGEYLAQLPGSVTYQDPGIRGIWWSDYADSYPFPGPKVYKAGSQQPTQATTTTTTTKQTPTTTAPTTPTVVPTTPTTETKETEGPVVPVQAAVTVTLSMNPTQLQISTFASDVTGVLAIPADAISNIVIDIDSSTDTTTVVHFLLNNALKPDGTRVDPVAAAFKLRDMAAAKDPALSGTVYLANMQVNSVEEQQSETADSNFVGSQTFIIIIAAVGGAVLIAAAVVITLFIVKKRRATWL